MTFCPLLFAFTDVLRSPLQREVVTATLEGEDVFLQAATSFGKSLCYQLPAVVDFGSMFKST
jgi:superfamily II DNA helicase RecQ